ncbi:MAG: HEAT repeat domain-containing protein, partial [Deltaproteobacteria bacterium]|nr:HEAT repeat domain-containing protein [Deltaproteobacteria bacterium]
MDVKKLINELSNSEEIKRREACNMLGDLGATEAARPLVGAFRDESWLVREAAVAALIKIGGEKGIALLLSVLTDEDARVRNSAIEILTGLGDK